MFSDMLENLPTTACHHPRLETILVPNCHENFLLVHFYFTIQVQNSILLLNYICLDLCTLHRNSFLTKIIYLYVKE